MPFQTQRPGLGGIGWNKISPWENVRIAQADYLGKRWGMSLLKMAVLSQAETLRQTRPVSRLEYMSFSQGGTLREKSPSLASLASKFLSTRGKDDFEPNLIGRWHGIGCNVTLRVLET